ncbi:thiopurine S-methyltransferase [Halioxenophilus sp. WMMB6]|uniref:thiopurine S-methyltransferase n=1 Tax=Halioxenophilus sp. WMMB6 TaxID=3073815 RepID=UPI00295F58E1|nr:thiopurine S-methyltransferase [Halioxenophilus sp. WMMB6]
MEQQFWFDRWAKREIGFHMAAPHPLLIKHFSRLALAANSHVLTPLCGKSLDLHWLLAQGCRVTGVELSEAAVKELFAELKLSPVVSAEGALRRYQAGALTVFVGDLFALKAEQLAAVDAIYDRAALVALPQSMRGDYAQQLLALSQSAPQLIVTMEYDQSLQPGPPFAVSEAMVRGLYESHYAIELVERVAVEGGLKGLCPAEEAVWQLTPR